ncbi:UBP-type zinc finger domain-containing protein [Streptomyces subrutilus]|uniref:UBP-type zinc finger domain-containing protein n=1 Tax=Streptomyces subrutilus TaxID=36818 RepID=UPI0034267DD7
MPRWTVAYDAGRPEGRSCGHADQAEATAGEPAAEARATAASAARGPSDGGPAPAAGCDRCLAAGQSWVHLRICLTCGSVGCCDSSRGQHAWSHAVRTGHPLARSAEAGEEWAWCYEDELFLVPATAPGRAHDA